MASYEDENVLGNPPLEPVPECSLGEYLWRKLKSLPEEKILQVDSETGASQSVEGFMRSSASLAEGLRKLGVQEDDAVGLLCRNSLEASDVVFASWLLGAAVAPVDGSMKLYELTNAFNLTKPKVIFCEEEMAPNVLSALNLLAATSIVIVTDNSESSSSCWRCLKDVTVGVDVDVGRYEPRQVTRPSERLAAILPSSGTSGLPKAVGITHKNFVFQDSTLNFVKGFREGLDCLQISQFFWVTAMLSFVRSLSTGMKRILVKRTTAEDVLRAVDEHKPEWTLVAPLFLLSVTTAPEFDRYDVSSLKTILVGGSPFSPAVADKIKEKWKHATFVQIYGTTEASGILTATQEGGDLFSAGRVVPGVQLKIVEPETNEPLKANVLGEVRVKTPGAMKHYVGNEEATAESLDSSGWIRTGDIGYRDDSGQVYLVDRLKEMIKIRNMQVAPAEVESAIMSVSGVKEAGVAAVSLDAAVCGLTALVVKEENASLNENDICSHVERTLSDYKKLTAGVHFVEFLPKTANGKIQRHVLKKMAQSLHSST